MLFEHLRDFLSGDRCFIEIHLGFTLLAFIGLLVVVAFLFVSEVGVDVEEVVIPVVLAQVFVSGDDIDCDER